MTEENLRPQPQNELDFNLMLTDSVWGKEEVSPALKDRLTQYFASQDEQGKVMYDEEGRPIVTKTHLWGVMSFFTRDIRLGNLSTFDGELNACRYYLDLAGDFLSINMIRPFIISLSRAATILETSQSKGGFLRRILNTLRREHITTNQEPPKKGFFGGKKQEGGY